MCLDVLRALRPEPAAVDALLAEAEAARGADRRLDASIEALKGELRQAADLEHEARALVERMALALQGAILVRHAPPTVADAFCAARLADRPGRQLGVLPAGLDLEAICERALPRPT